MHELSLKALHDACLALFVPECRCILFEMILFEMTSCMPLLSGLVYCMDFVEQNLDWLREKLAPYETGNVHNDKGMMG